MKISIENGALMPSRAHLSDAGLDIKSPVEGIIPPHTNKALKVFTGVHVSIPGGHVGLIKSRSGLMMNWGICVEGVIDPGYSGQIVLNLFNHGDTPFRFHKGDRIAQLLIVPIVVPELSVVSLGELEEDAKRASTRGDKGFGSTGK